MEAQPCNLSKLVLDVESAIEDAGQIRSRKRPVFHEN